MPQLTVDPKSRFQGGYPSWIAALTPDRNPCAALYVVRDLDPGRALEQVGAGLYPIGPVRLPTRRPFDPRSSRAHLAVGAVPPDCALISTRVGGWTVVLDTSGMTFGDEAISLSKDGHEAASCSVNADLDTHLGYAVDGDRRFWVTEPVSRHSIADLPEGLRTAARTSGVFASPGRPCQPDAADNFQLLCALAGLSLSLEELSRLPLLGTRLDATR